MSHEADVHLIYKFHITRNFHVFYVLKKNLYLVFTVDRSVLESNSRSQISASQAIHCAHRCTIRKRVREVRLSSTSSFVFLLIFQAHNYTYIDLCLLMKITPTKHIHINHNCAYSGILLF